jgi:hypothetical protein
VLFGASAVGWLESCGRPVLTDAMPSRPRSGRLTLAGAVVALALLAAACSGDDGDDAADSTSPVAESTVDPATTDDPTAMTIDIENPPDPVELPEIVAQEQPTGPEAEIVVTCLGLGDCEGAIAPDLIWPGAVIEGQSFPFAVLIDADLSGAEANFIHLGGADASGATFVGASLSGANLRGTDFTGADLTGADLTGADLSGAILIDAVIVGVDWRGVFFCETEMPDGSIRDDDC